MAINRGFSLIELLVALVVMGILMTFLMPVYSDYVRNVKVRVEAESFVSGVQLARAEAVRRNVPVEFLLTSDAPTEANVATATASASGPNWIVRTADMAIFIEGKIAAASAGASQVRINDTTSPAVDDVGDPPPGSPIASITFNSLGRAAIAADTAFKFTVPGVKCQTDSGPVRCMRVTVSVFGQARLCDPRTAAGDPRSC